MLAGRGGLLMRGVCVIAVGCAALLLGQVGPTAAPAAARSPVLTFYFGLKRPESRAIAAFWAVQQPGTATYRRFMTLADIGRLYGATPATRSAFSAAMRRLGLAVSIDPTGVFGRVRGTRSQLQRAFHVRITSTYDDFATSYQANRRLRLPARVRRLVREVVAVSDRTTLHPGSILPPRLGAAPGPGNAGRWINGCRAARRTGAYSFAQLRQAYRIDRVRSGGGGSVAILNDAETVLPHDIAENARCFGLPAGRVRTVFTDGQTHRFTFGTFEPNEDLALVRGVAPRLSSVLLTGVWGAPELWFLGPAKLLREPKLPDALTVSYGYCERQFLDSTAGRQGSRLLNAMYVRLGLAGVGVFGSAGDSGSTCNGSPLPGVAWPAASPYVTAVGGTRLVVNRRNQRTNEVVWNDLRWLKPENGGGAGGGGVSSFYPRPPYQRGIHVPGNRRSVPDISVHASMLPGYPVFGARRWFLDAGTSAASPLAAAAFAVLSARQRAAGQPPLGPVNGLLYWLRRNRPGALYDIVAGDNGFNRHIPGHRARRGYDLATGLGVPRFDQISSALPAPGSG